MTQLGRWLTSGFVLLASLVVPPALGADQVCAVEGDRAVLVVDTGGSVQKFCVSLPDGETSGLGLIALANEQHGLPYKLGFGGEAVCMLAGVGPTGDDCFEDYPDFWGYWRGDGSGGWVWSGTGAGSTTVEDGDVEGWSWGSGSNGDSHPRPPPTILGDVCATATEQPHATKPRPRDDDPAPSGSAGGGPARPRGPAPGPTAATAGGQPAAKTGSKPPRGDTDAPRKERDRRAGGGSDKRVGIATVESPSPSALDELATGALEPAERSGPPPAGLAALGAAALLGGAGFVFARRRRSSASVR